MPNALGQLPNAPLVYVLAQVRFTHVPHIEKRCENFHELVFASYPRLEKERIDQISIEDGQPKIGDSLQRWHLSDGSKTTGLILEAGSLVLHTTDYVTSKEFLAELKRVLSEFQQVLPEKGVLVSRLGLRYVDLLLPEDGLVVDEQVIETLRLPDLESIGRPKRMDQVVSYSTATGGTMVIRHRQSTEPNVLPADLFPVRLNPARRLARPRPKDAIVGLLDYDHYIEQEQPFAVDAIVSTFRKLREISSATFKATTTSEANVKWNKEGL